MYTLFLLFMFLPFVFPCLCICCIFIFLFTEILYIASASRSRPGGVLYYSAPVFVFVCQMFYVICLLCDLSVTFLFYVVVLMPV